MVTYLEIVTTAIIISRKKQYQKKDRHLVTIGKNIINIVTYRTDMHRMILRVIKLSLKILSTSLKNFSFILSCIAIVIDFANIFESSRLQK